MPRRLHFTNTKNYERKKQAQKRQAKQLQNNDFVSAKGLCDSMLLSNWKNMSNDSGDEIRLCKVSSQPGVSCHGVSKFMEIKVLVVETHLCRNF